MDKVHNHTFARRLHERGYSTGLFGKYLNAMPPGGEKPRGWDAWMANAGGDYLAPNFVVRNVTGLGDGAQTFSDETYTTALVGNVSTAWIRDVVTADQGRPFFVYVAPKARSKHNKRLARRAKRDSSTREREREGETFWGTHAV